MPGSKSDCNSIVGNLERFIYFCHTWKGEFKEFLTMKGRIGTREATNVRKVLATVFGILKGLLPPSRCRWLHSQVTLQWLLLLSGVDTAITVYVCVFVCVCAFFLFVGFWSLVLISTVGFDNYCNKWIPSELVDNEFLTLCVCVCLTERGLRSQTKDRVEECRDR